MLWCLCVCNFIFIKQLFYREISQDIKATQMMYNEQDPCTVKICALRIKISAALHGLPQVMIIKLKRKNAKLWAY